MEQKWTIKTFDGATIYGVKNSAATNQKSAIFIVHGLTGHMYEYAFKRAADFFQPDYDVYRFNLYDGAPGARQLIDCTVSTHATDLQEVLRHFSANYDRVFLIGHSYGGPTIMLANPPKITAVSLWDPSYDLRKVQQAFKDNYLEKEGYHIVEWGTNYLISRSMYEEAAKMDADFCAKLSKNFSSPVQVIQAGDGYYVKDKYSYDSFCAYPHARTVIPGTTHCFYEGNSCEMLLSETKSWFDRHLVTN